VCTEAFVRVGVVGWILPTAWLQDTSVCASTTLDTSTGPQGRQLLVSCVLVLQVLAAGAQPHQGSGPLHPATAQGVMSSTQNCATVPREGTAGPPLLPGCPGHATPAACNRICIQRQGLACDGQGDLCAVNHLHGPVVDEVGLRVLCGVESLLHHYMLHTWRCSSQPA
jgi:hypothetical protein